MRTPFVVELGSVPADYVEWQLEGSVVHSRTEDDVQVLMVAICSLDTVLRNPFDRDVDEIDIILDQRFQVSGTWRQPTAGHGEGGHHCASVG